MIDIEMIENKNDAKGYPKSAVGYKSTVSEIIAAFEFLETCKHLGQTAKYEAKRHNGTEYFWDIHMP